jgi:hypothetical protein
LRFNFLKSLLLKLKKNLRFAICSFILLLIVPEKSFAQRDTASLKTDQVPAVRQVDLIDLKKRLFMVRHRVEPEDAKAADSISASNPIRLGLLTDKLYPLNDSIPFSTPLTKASPELNSLKMVQGKIYPSYAPAPGYNIQNGLLVIVACNFSFLTGKSENTNVSAISFNPDYSFTYHQVMLPVVFDVWSSENKINLLGDWRYYYYPTYTYGLGGQSSLANYDLINYSYFRFYQQALKQIDGTKFYAGLGYDLDYHFDIRQIDSAGTGTDFKQYNAGATHTASSGLTANLLYDSRKNSNNPVDDATFCSLTYRSNMKLIGSDQNWQSAYLDFRKYIKLSPNNNNMLTFWNIEWFTFGGNPPYFDLPSTGWDPYSNTGRGYIQGRLRGPDFIYLESEYRFGITKNGLIGGVLFANAESVSLTQNPVFQTILPGYGFGIRIKVNKYSGVNFAIDYGFGTQGSSGPAFNVSEVF